jgi:uncharacterized protein YggE
MLKMKRFPPFPGAGMPAAAALALVLALAAGHAAASTIPDYPFVHVTGSAFRMELPDIATLDFEIVAADADPAAARAVIEARVGEVRALMQQLSIDADDMQVREVRQTLRKEQPAAGAPVYELRGDVHIRLRNLANWPALGGGLLGKPNLDSFAASFDLSTMDKVNDELVTEAIADARHRAEVMAAASGRRLGPVMAATPDALKKLGTAMGLEREEFRMPRSSGRGTGNARAEDIDRNDFLMIQSLKLRQPVDVIFRLENAAPAATQTRRARSKE